MNGMSIYAVDLLLIICISTVYSARPLTPYQRSFTPTRNISCSQCEMKVETDKSKSFIETDMYRRRCLDEPEIFFKPCIVNDKNRPRGCAKLTTYLKEPTSKGRVKEVTLMKRFCATEGAESEEIKCYIIHLKVVIQNYVYVVQIIVIQLQIYSNHLHISIIHSLYQLFTCF
uniref:Uncharacterized protein n=1 Tax=Schistosoma japonicum TaxID=6182 RepID=C1LIC2_SCHJA|nr:hypothetical protein [Schistosoma japonicum]